MIRLLDTSRAALSAYEAGAFDLERWKAYIRANFPSAEAVCLADMRQSVSPQYPWEQAFLPVLNAAYRQKEAFSETVRTFHLVTENLEQRLQAVFGKTPDVKIVLSLGLCNGAGWVTELERETVILLGIEKIIELGWYHPDDMNGLVLHELGHAYQARFGVLERAFESPADGFLWQLFTEGIAMAFEQEALGNADYFHQDRNGWKAWCGEHLGEIADGFARDMHEMTRENQRYFGDWAFFNGRPDVGYYLGARLVRFAMRQTAFDNLLCWTIDDVKRLFRDFRASLR